MLYHKLKKQNELNVNGRLKSLRTLSG